MANSRAGMVLIGRCGSVLIAYMLSAEWYAKKVKVKKMIRRSKMGEFLFGPKVYILLFTRV